MASDKSTERAGCCIYLENEESKSKATMAHVICKHFGNFSFYNARAMKSSAQSPATNHIMSCDKCPVRQYIWSYNMAAHMAAAHPKVPLCLESAELRAAITMTEKERGGLEKLKVAKLSKRKREARAERTQEAERAAKAAWLQEELAAQPLGRGQRDRASAVAE